jgi:hypothetical protein
VQNGTPYFIKLHNGLIYLLSDKFLSIVGNDKVNQEIQLDFDARSLEVCGEEVYIGDTVSLYQ